MQQQATDYKAQQAARDFTALQLQQAHPHLVAAGDPLTTAAKNIRIELKRAFPGVKFSVKTSRFSMGDSITVSWTDGPQAKQVDEIADKYAAGSFDGSQDLYTYERNAWRDAFGDAKYVSTSRSYSDQAIAGAIRTAAARYHFNGIQVPTVDDWKNGRAWNVSPIVGGSMQTRGDWQSLISIELSRRTWAIAKKI
jgi:hypothetical protein